MSEQIVSDRGALPAREVGYVAKSVAEFVYYRYTGAGNAPLSLTICSDIAKARVTT
ncbi:hypothetical protein KAM358_44240 [Aeromonas caviae]|nr:hypothetical protein KAM358_44240 [Aeromonas caviae]